MSQATLPDVPIADGYSAVQAAQQPSPQPSKPHFKIVNLQAPSSVQPGATVEVDVTITNDGQAEGTVEARILDTQGNIVASQSVTLSPGQSATLKPRFTVPSSPGTYSYKAEAYNQATKTVDDTRSFSIMVQSQGGGAQPQPQPPQQPQQQAQATQPQPSSGIPGWAIALGIVALIGIAALAFTGAGKEQQAQA